ncbi:MAG TPA: hypothetical protein VJ953_21975 [Saprospiraceae bacterium]|nr:hypothetical protein [Saprospiraceae bacterium]
MNKTHTYHQLLVDYIDHIGQTDCPEARLPHLPANFVAGWSASYRVQPIDNTWELRISQFNQQDHLFFEVMRQRYPSKVVADIMGRYHCRRINQETHQIKPSNSSPQLLN